MYVLDTNTVIYFFKGAGRVAEHLFSKSAEEIAIPSIVLYELSVGIAKSNNPRKRKEQLNHLLSSIRVLPFTTKEAETSAIIRAELEAKGMPIGPYDILIAGVAKHSNAILVTHNTKEFQRVQALRLEDWY